MSVTADLESIELSGNNEPKCPCILLLDTSSSMSGDRINSLNEGLRTFATTIKEDALASLRCELLVVTFDSTVKVLGNFVTADQFEVPTLSAGGETSMANGVLHALKLIGERKVEYRKLGSAYYRPWIFLITDGAPTDGDQAWRGACNSVAAAEEAKGVCFFAVGVEGAAMEKLAELSVRAPLKLQGLKFDDLFAWLSESLSQVSSKDPGAQSALPSPMGWAAVD